MVMAKHFSKSRTLRFNGIIFTLATLLLPVIVENQELIRTTVSPTAYLLLLMGVTLINAWLRTQTSTGISSK